MKRDFYDLYLEQFPRHITHNRVREKIVKSKHYEKRLIERYPYDHESVIDSIVYCIMAWTTKHCRQNYMVSLWWRIHILDLSDWSIVLITMYEDVNYVNRMTFIWNMFRYVIFLSVNNTTTWSILFWNIKKQLPRIIR